MLKKLTGLFLSFVFVATMMPTNSFADAKENVSITIVGTSDVHGRFVPWEYAMDAENKAGSLTQIYTGVKQIRKENPNTILVDAGDSIQDNYAETFIKNEKNPMVVGMNEMGYDTWTMGNHEFNFEREDVDRTIAQFKGSALAGNIYKEDGSRYLPAYKIVEKDGVKIGIIGMDTPMITQFEEKTNHLKGLVVKQPIEETKKAIAELKGKVDVLVGVMHMGEKNENNIAGTGVADIANACPELSVIIAGHMHENISGKAINGVLITEPSKYGTAISRVDLSFKKDKDGYKLVDKKAKTIDVKNFASDKDLEKKLEGFHNTLRKNANEVIGKVTGTDMVKKDEIKGIPTVQIESTPLVNFFHDVEKHYGKSDVVAVQIDLDNAKMDLGDMKKKDIAYNYRYTGGEVTVYEVTGADLKAYMEWAAGYFNTLKDGDITVSFDPERRASKYSTNDFFGGVTYKVDLTKEKGNRIVDLKFADGKEIKSDTKLTLGMNSYRMAMLVKEGGPLVGKTFKEIYSTKTEFGEDDGTIRNLGIKYVTDVKKGLVEANTNKNWEIIGLDKNSKERAIVAKLINEGKLELPKTTDGKYTNIASINVKGKTNLTQDAFNTKLKELKDKYSKAKDDKERNIIHGDAELLRALNPQCK